MNHQKYSKLLLRKFGMNFLALFWRFDLPEVDTSPNFLMIIVLELTQNVLAILESNLTWFIIFNEAHDCRTLYLIVDFTSKKGLMTVRNPRLHDFFRATLIEIEECPDKLALILMYTPNLQLRQNLVLLDIQLEFTQWTPAAHVAVTNLGWGRHVLHLYTYSFSRSVVSIIL